MAENPVKPENLFVLWSSGNREVATKMVFMYTLNAKLREWWNDVSPLFRLYLLRFTVHGLREKILFQMHKRMGLKRAYGYYTAKAGRKYEHTGR